MAKKSRRTKNARRRLAGLHEIDPRGPQPPFDTELFVIETMQALKTGGSEKVREDLSTWQTPVFHCKCGNKGRVLECGRLFVKGKGWSWVCGGAIRSHPVRGGVYRDTCGRDLVKGRDYVLPWEDESEAAMRNPFREIHEQYEAAVMSRVEENLSSAGPDEPDSAATPGESVNTEVVVDAADSPEGTICHACGDTGRVLGDICPECVARDCQVCPTCRGTGWSHAHEGHPDEKVGCPDCEGTGELSPTENVIPFKP